MTTMIALLFIVAVAFGGKYSEKLTTLYLHAKQFTIEEIPVQQLHCTNTDVDNACEKYRFDFVECKRTPEGDAEWTCVGVHDKQLDRFTNPALIKINVRNIHCSSSTPQSCSLEYSLLFEGWMAEKVRYEQLLSTCSADFYTGVFVFLVVFFSDLIILVAAVGINILFFEPKEKYKRFFEGNDSAYHKGSADVSVVAVTVTKQQPNESEKFE